MLLANCLRCGDAVHLRHFDVHDHNIGPKLTDLLHRARTIANGGNDLVARFGEGLDDIHANEALILSHNSRARHETRILAPFSGLFHSFVLVHGIQSFACVFVVVRQAHSISIVQHIGFQSGICRSPERYYSRTPGKERLVPVRQARTRWLFYRACLKTGTWPGWRNW